MSASTVPQLDLQGLSCPLIIIKAAQAINEFQRGETVEVWATDPGSVPDFSEWCHSTGNELVESSREDGVFRFVVRKR